jgi:hypothetical protein
MQKEKRNHTASGFQNSCRDVVLAGKRPQFAPNIKPSGAPCQPLLDSLQIIAGIDVKVVRRSNSARLIRLRAYKLPGDICTHG